MSTKGPTAKEVAFWRYERIQEALAEDLTRAERARILHRISKTPVLWPSGQTKAVPIATSYRWVRLYHQGQLDALRPKRRSDLGVSRVELPVEVVQEALRLLTDDPHITFTFLLGVLRPRYPEVRIARSTLQQRLGALPEYQRIKRLKRRQKRRGRFVASAPHEIWQCDGKGPVRVKLSCGKLLLFHILSIIDDATRAVLAAIVSLRADLAAAVRVFRMAATRWGLPGMLYADRASIFDAKAFRMGLAQIGSYRIPTKPRNAEARGKIEAYHRTLSMWFTDRLPRQVVIDHVHLQKLLDGVIYGLYQPHKHRGIKTAPELALAGRVSERQVPPTRLVEAFRQDRRLKAHRKTGEVEIAAVTYLVPDELRGQRLTFKVDPAGEVPPLVKHPVTGLPTSVRRAAIKPEDLEHVERPPAPSSRRGAGALQMLYDTWQGQTRPQAEPGFGLPELYALLSKACGRHVPSSDGEAALVQRVYQAIGPLPKEPTERAMTAIAQQLGPRRPVKTYLDALEKRVQQHAARKQQDTSCPE